MTRAAARLDWPGEVWRDAVIAWRGLRRTPVFTLTAVATIAIAIAVNTTVFSFVEALLFERLPYANADQLVIVRKGMSATLGEAMALRERARSISDLAVYRDRSITLNDGAASRLDGVAITANMFPMLGVRPLLGNGFAANASDPGSDRVIILSHSLWQTRFGADPGIIGRRLLVDGQPFAVVGIMAPDFRFPTARAEFWVPLAIDRSNLAGMWASGGAWFVARLRPGASPAVVQGELRTTVAEMRHLNPLWDPGADYGKALELTPFRRHLIGGVESAVLLVWACAAVVLLVACVNLANLLLARASARDNELAVRAALGAGRGRLVRQLLTESFAIAVLGAMGGVTLAAAGTGWIASVAPQDFPRLGDTEMRVSIYIFSIALTGVATLMFGLLPALRATVSSATTRAVRATRAGRSGVAHHHVAAALVVAEVAIAVVLTVIGGILARSFVALREISPGFRTDHVVVAQVNPPAAGFADNARALAFYDALLLSARGLPGVAQAAAADRLPIANPVYGIALRIEGKYEDIRHRLPWIPHFQSITPGYLDAFGIPVLRGRSFSSADDENGAPVAIVSQSLARQYWPGEEAIGKRVGSPYPSPWMTIVGVVPDIRLDSLRDTSSVALYVPLAQRFSRRFGAPPSPSLGIALRTSADPSSVEQAIRGVVESVDRNVAVSRIRTMDGVIDASLAKPRFTASLVGAFAVVTLLLGAVGIYGVMSYLVSQRTHELGVRAALGASSRAITLLVLRRALLLSGTGAVAGIVLASFATAALPSLLFHVSPLDPLTFGLVPLVFMVIALVASALPARRAAHSDPMCALRGA